MCSPIKTTLNGVELFIHLHSFRFHAFVSEKMSATWDTLNIGHNIVAAHIGSPVLCRRFFELLSKSQNVLF